MPSSGSERPYIKQHVCALDDEILSGVQHHVAALIVPSQAYGVALAIGGGSVLAQQLDPDNADAVGEGLVHDNTKRHLAQVAEVAAFLDHGGVELVRGAPSIVEHGQEVLLSPAELQDRRGMVGRGFMWLGVAHGVLQPPDVDLQIGVLGTQSIGGGAVVGGVQQRRHQRGSAAVQAAGRQQGHPQLLVAEHDPVAVAQVGLVLRQDQVDVLLDVGRALTDGPGPQDGLVVSVAGRELVGAGKQKHRLGILHRCAPQVALGTRGRGKGECGGWGTEG